VKVGGEPGVGLTGGFTSVGLDCGGVFTACWFEGAGVTVSGFGPGIWVGEVNAGAGVTAEGGAVLAVTGAGAFFFFDGGFGGVTATGGAEGCSSLILFRSASRAFSMASGLAEGGALSIGLAGERGLGAADAEAADGGGAAGADAGGWTTGCGAGVAGGAAGLGTDCVRGAGAGTGFFFGFVGVAGAFVTCVAGWLMAFSKASRALAWASLSAAA
jgi:hypothetical protein